MNHQKTYKISLKKVILASLSLLELACLDGCQQRTISRPDDTTIQVAKYGLSCLEKDDSACIGELISDQEALKTGLDARAARAIIEGPFSEDNKFFKPVDEPTLNPLDSSKVEIERTFLTPDGRA